MVNSFSVEWRRSSVENVSEAKKTQLPTLLQLESQPLHVSLTYLLIINVLFSLARRFVKQLHVPVLSFNELAKGRYPVHTFPSSKSATQTTLSLQQVCNKLARAKVRCVCCVVSFPKFHYNDLLPTSPQQLRSFPV